MAPPKFIRERFLRPATPETETNTASRSRDNPAATDLFLGYSSSSSLDFAFKPSVRSRSSPNKVIKFPGTTQLRRLVVDRSGTLQTKSRKWRVTEKLNFNLGPSRSKIVVGKPPEQRTFLVHEDLLIARSKLLRSMMTMPKNAAPSIAVELPEEDPDAFHLYSNLIYFGVIRTLQGFEEWPTLCRLYILAEKLQDAQAQNSIMDIMHECIHECSENGGLDPRALPCETRPKNLGQLLGRTPIAELYEGTSISSPARKYILDLYAWYGQSYTLDTGSDAPHDFLFDLAKALMNQRHRPLFTSMLDWPSTKYHQPLKMSDSNKAERKEEARPQCAGFNAACDAVKRTAYGKIKYG